MLYRGRGALEGRQILSAARIDMSLVSAFGQRLGQPGRFRHLGAHVRQDVARPLRSRGGET